MTNKIAIIIPYFGKWPEWIDLYLFSCAENSNIRWYIFTDCEEKQAKPNLHFTYLSFENYCTFVSERLNIDFKPDSAYKLCDLKPFYGYIHQNILSNYSFWGFGDIDVVWGNISEFYTDTLLGKYNVFSTHADRLSGHFSLIRNETRYTELCFKIAEWQSKLEDHNYNYLDEVYYSRLLYPESKYIVKFYNKIIRKVFNWRDAWVIYYHLVPLLNRILFVKKRKLYFKEQHTTPILSDDGLSCKHDADTWYYKGGKVTNSKTSNEYIYLHFMIYKKNSMRPFYYWKDNFYNVPKYFNFRTGVTINKISVSPILEN